MNNRSRIITLLAIIALTGCQSTPSSSANPTESSKNEIISSTVKEPDSSSIIENYYTVKFETGTETAVTDQKLIDGKGIILPYVERQGYQLDGWYLGDTKIDNTFIADSDVTLTAKWIGEEYLIAVDYSSVIDEYGFIHFEVECSQKACFGESVTITVSQKKNKYPFTPMFFGGIEIDSVKVSDDLTYEFTMPDHSITIKPIGLEQYHEENGLRFSYSGKSYTCCGISSSYESETLEIPEEINGRKVTSLSFQYAGFNGKDAEYDYQNSHIKELIIPESITSISISGASFPALKKICIKGNTEFSNCQIAVNAPELSEIVLDEDNTYFDTSLLSDNILVSKADRKLILGGINAVIPDNIDTIGYGCFAFRNISSISIPEGVKAIEKEAFYGSSVSSLDLPASLETLKTGALTGMYSLNHIAVAEENRYFETPEGKECLISKDDRYVLLATNSTIVPKDVKGFSDRSFAYTSLESISIPDSEEEFDLSQNPFGQVDDSVYPGMKETLTTLGNPCYEKSNLHSSLNSLSIGNNVTADSIRQQCFRMMHNISSITISSDNPDIEEKGNCIIDKETGKVIYSNQNSTFEEGSVLSCYAYDPNTENVVIPDNVEVVDRGAIIEYDLADFIPDIENYNSIASIEFGKDVRKICSGSIQSYSNNIKKCFIPKTVESIASRAFYISGTSFTICCESKEAEEGWTYGFNLRNDMNGVDTFYNTKYGYSQADFSYLIIK